MNEKFYQKTWFIWVMILLFWPIGLLLLWKSDKYTTKIKAIISIIFILVISFAMLNSPSSTTKNEQTNSKNSVQTESVTKKSETQEDNYNHLNDAEKILQQIYDDNAMKLGVGAPTVDVSFTSYRQWESAPGLTESDGNFELSSEQGLKHKFNIRWGKNSNDIIRIVIDGKRIYYNEDLQIKYMDNAK